MIRKKIVAAVLLLMMFCSVELSAQEVVSRIAGLETNEEYMSLLRSDERLRIKTDSLLGVIRSVRGALTKNAESRDSLAQLRSDSMLIILTDAESAIYATRAQKVKLIDKINSIEQNFVLSSMGNIGGAQQAEGSKSIYKNSYFINSLDGEDYRLLLDVHAKEKNAAEYAQTYVKNYSRIKMLYNKYVVAKTEAEAEAIYGEMSGVMDENMILERQLAKVWSEVYDHKTYVYSYFLEKENRVDLLDLTEGMMDDARQEKLNVVDDCISESVVDYCLQKPIALNYEIYVAKLLNLAPAIDSLSIVARNVRSIDYRMPLLDVERRSFVKYETIEFNSKSPYNATNPIPDCEVYEYGTVYRILLGTFKYKQSVSIFRGASPLYVEKGEDGRFSYYAGGFQTRDEAESAQTIMKKKGFRNPQIVEWVDGIKTNLSEDGEGVRATYRISIKGAELDDMVKEVIASMAEDCQISRLNEQHFIVAPFDSKAVAERVAQAIRKCDSNLSVEVIEVMPEPQSEEDED